jgi:hypothetical protein
LLTCIFSLMNVLFVLPESFQESLEILERILLGFSLVCVVTVCSIYCGEGGGYNRHRYNDEENNRRKPLRFLIYTSNLIAALILFVVSTSKTPRDKVQVVRADISPWELSVQNGPQMADLADSGDKLLKVLVINANYGHYIGNAMNGATMGELVYWRSVLFALAHLKIDVEFATTIYHVKSLVVQGREKEFDVVVTDIYTISSILENCPSIFAPSYRCKFLLLDDWGTPPEQNSLLLHTRQYMVPWNFTGHNYVLGHMLPPVVLRGAKKHQAVLWGKEPRYFKDFQDLIAEIQKLIPLVATAKEDAQFPDGVVNLGIVDQATRNRLFRESKFLIGFGDPVIGLTPLEGLNAGMAYINPLFSPPKNFSMNVEFCFSSQHFEAEKYGKPYVYTVDIQDMEQVLGAVKDILSHNGGRGIGSYRRPELTERAFVSRLNHILREDFCSASPPLPEEVPSKSRGPLDVLSSPSLD